MRPSHNVTCRKHVYVISSTFLWTSLLFRSFFSNSNIKKYAKWLYVITRLAWFSENQWIINTSTIPVLTGWAATMYLRVLTDLSTSLLNKPLKLPYPGPWSLNAWARLPNDPDEYGMPFLYVVDWITWSTGIYENITMG